MGVAALSLDRRVVFICSYVETIVMPSTEKSEPAKDIDYGYLMADGRPREFIWGKEVRQVGLSHPVGRGPTRSLT